MSIAAYDIRGEQSQNSDYFTLNVNIFMEGELGVGLFIKGAFWVHGEKMWHVNKTLALNVACYFKIKTSLDDLFHKNEKSFVETENYNHYRYITPISVSWGW